MSYFELYQESPLLPLIVLLISFVATIFVYGAFPFIFAKTTKKPITKKKYKRLCYGLNIIGVVLFISLNGAVSGGPYLLWTWIFSNYGVKTLTSRRLLKDNEQPNDLNNGVLGNDSYESMEETTEKFQQIPDLATAIKEEKHSSNHLSSTTALNKILDDYAKSTVEDMEANRKNQPDNEGDADFGLVPEKPIFTHALKSVQGEKEYLNSLYTANGEKIKYNRTSSISVEGINGIIDVYDIYLPSGELYKTIYINMYGAKSSNKAPIGFILNNPTTKSPSMQKKGKDIKAKYCSNCGARIDNTAKFCTKCGRRCSYEFRLSKFSATVTILVLLITVLSTLYILQYTNEQKIIDLENQIVSEQDKNSKLRDKNNKLNDDIEVLEDEIDILEYKNSILPLLNWQDQQALDFYEEYAVVVNENSNKYHKYGCEDFDDSYFWIYNTEAAKEIGYYACNKCN